MAEWSKAQHWKCCIGETLSWVQIPLSPPFFFAKKMANEDASLLFTVRSTTSHLHAAKPLFTKTPFRLACEAAHFIRL